MIKAFSVDAGQEHQDEKPEQWREKAETCIFIKKRSGMTRARSEQAAFESIQECTCLSSRMFPPISTEQPDGSWIDCVLINNALSLCS